MVLMLVRGTTFRRRLLTGLSFFLVMGLMGLFMSRFFGLF
jgi:hypothetical protein